MYLLYDIHVTATTYVYKNGLQTWVFDDYLYTRVLICVLDDLAPFHKPRVTLCECYYMYHDTEMFTVLAPVTGPCTFMICVAKSLNIDLSWWCSIANG